MAVKDTGAAVHEWTETEARITIPGLAGEVRVLHVTDSHITVSDDRDLPFREFAARMDAAFVASGAGSAGGKPTPLECLDAALGTAVDCGADLVTLTGDIVNNPSETSVEAVTEKLKSTGIDFLYTAGNHDWHYEGMEGSSEELRRSWRDRRLRPFYRGNPSCESRVVGGIELVTIDNSTYQVDDEQLAFFREAAGRGRPMVLLIHIPLAIVELDHILCGHPDWGAGTDENYIIERRRRWPESGNARTTEEFVRAVSAAPNLVAIMAGHTHRDHVGPVEPLIRRGAANCEAMQYVTAAGVRGGCRLFTFTGA